MTRLPRGVVLLGLVSLCNDAASDMILPLLPAFLLTLGAGSVERLGGDVLLQLEARVHA